MLVYYLLQAASSFKQGPCNLLLTPLCCLFCVLNERAGAQKGRHITNSSLIDFLDAMV